MKYTDKQQFAERIKSLRAELGLTQQQMADAVGLRKTAISNYESGYSTPNLETLRKFMHEFNLPASYFLPQTSQYTAESKTAQLLYGFAIHYFEPDNIPGLLSGDVTMMDSSMSLPAKFPLPRTKHIATTAHDNSMNLAGIKKNSCIIINTEAREPQQNQIFAAIYDDELIIRRYVEIDGKACMKAESTRIPTGLSIKEIPSENFVILGIADAVVTDFSTNV